MITTMPSDVITFEEALALDEERIHGRSLLVGNGLSIEWKPDVFRYTSLYDEADLNGLSTSKDALFGALGTHDFERVVEHLKTAADLAELYEAGDPELSGVMRADAQVVRRGLADVLAARHPHHSNELTFAESESARAFLVHFGRIFTVNYDLLLYWVLNAVDGSAHSPRREDGFEWPTANGPRYLVWKRSAAKRGQRVFYLHGAFHLYVEDKRLRKLGFRDGRLMEQVRERLLEGRYPLVVTEGRSDEKLDRIERSAYLTYAHGALEELTGTLFIHGMSLSPNDDHILAKLESKDSQVETLFVGIHGDELSHGAQEVITRARLIKRRREDAGGRRLELHFYDSSSAQVWR
jgi:predicted NBD/HSP70 family sugar kinase